MTFKSALDIDCGIRYMYDTLEIMSPCGRKMLLAGEMMTSKRELDFYYRRLNEIYDKDCTRIAHKLMCLKDIQNTLGRLQEGTVLDDIELCGHIPDIFLKAGAGDQEIVILTVKLPVVQ